MSATETVEEYYEALRRGEPLSPYFAEREDVVKFGISDRLVGHEAVAEGLRDQTRTTEDWLVESRNPRMVTPESSADSAGGSSVGESTTGESVAWFTDDVGLSWADDAGSRRSFDTRWSGVLEREDGEEETGERDDRRWQFVQMHVSAPREL
ncbi:nuclear transport factor 2 family protein [Halorussus limi]|uniref:Nuclear transport factor 2 family protein n=1 Tax=Halorussus limi TaxID=2938695 RepID=A0A8U0HVL4_9EURY|nr:nuclear transport factor 2 family protein [Halorussus limi]UPV74736.1 nuclear transport factor 2 family protein [Halorussus limi]